MKTIIIGNSGSGKSWLAEKLTESAGNPVIHLDELFWKPGGFDKKRSKEEISSLIELAKENENWIVEGVFGELAKPFINQADFLIWLNIDWKICKARLIKRGSESKIHMERKQSLEGIRKLIEWASHYYNRADLRSHDGHKIIFQDFQGAKIQIKSQEQVNAIVKDVQQNTVAAAFKSQVQLFNKI
jgi:adenylate kinase family enzyme